MKPGVNQTVSFFVFVLRLYGDPVHPDWLVTKRETYWTITSNSSITIFFYIHICTYLQFIVLLFKQPTNLGNLNIWK